jgi:hypothetical protein
MESHRRKMKAVFEIKCVLGGFAIKNAVGFITVKGRAREGDKGTMTHDRFRMRMDGLQGQSHSRTRESVGESVWGKAGEEHRFRFCLFC